MIDERVRPACVALPTSTMREAPPVLAAFPPVAAEIAKLRGLDLADLHPAVVFPRRSRGTAGVSAAGRAVLAPGRGAFGLILARGG